MKKYLISLLPFAGWVCLSMTIFVSIRADEMPPAAEKTESAPSEKDSVDPHEWGEPVKGMAIGISSKKSTYTLGEPIIVNANYKNLGDKDCKFICIRDLVFDSKGLFCQCKLRVTYSNSSKEFSSYAFLHGKIDSKEVPLTLRGKDGHISLRGDATGVTLKPGEASSSQLHGWMNLWYDMSRPGEYRIVASSLAYQNEKGEPVYRNSNELVIKVIEPVAAPKEKQTE